MKTDDYEGHTPAPWIALDDNAVKTPKHDDPYAFIERRNDDGEIVSLSKADAQLIADAPKLLTEVKTLRVSDAALSAIAEVIDPEGVLQNNENLLAEVKRLREQPSVTIDEWDKVLNSEHEGPYVTLYLDGKEYIGALRLYKDENGEVIE